MGLVEDLNKIAAMQGKPPIDPGIIQGEGQRPAFDPDVPADWLDPELDMGEPAPSFAAPPSPLIPRRSPNHPTPKAPDPKSATQPPAGFDAPVFPEAPSLPTFSLCVADRLASWKTRSVTLTEPEEAAIRAIVLKAIQREVQADLAAVEKPRRTRRKPALGTVSDGVALIPGPTVRRKPGRPRKVTP